ncbi:MAG: L-lactate dehydrogenase [Firmicutes bacterium]|nr:L-lactate dehydrogenase [Bacillota bacterium]
MNGAAKVSIVGVGLVGSATAFALMESGLLSEICLIDKNADRAEGQALDLAHGASFVRPVRVYSADISGCSGSDVIVVTAGRNQKPGETRVDLSRDNAAVLREVMSEIDRHAPPEAVVIVVTNPVDVLTHVAALTTTRDPSRVMGSGTVLDSSRFRYLLSGHCGVDPRNVHAYVIGEHGDTEVPAWSLTNIAGARLDEFCPACPRGCDNVDRENIARNVRESAYHIIDMKGATYWAIAFALRRIIESVLRDEHSVLTVSTMLTGQHGISGVCLSLPSIVNRTGVATALELPLSAGEVEGLRRSAEAMRAIQRDLGY